MNDFFNQRADQVNAALTQAVPDCARQGPSSWQFLLGPDPLVMVTATLDGNWLLLETDGPGNPAGQAPVWDALEKNGLLPGLVKYAVNQAGRLQLRAELPLPEDADVVTRIREVCSGFEAALGGRAEDRTAGDRAHPGTAPVFSLSSPEGGEGRGEEALDFTTQIPSPQPSPRLGGERGLGVVSACDTGNPEAAAAIDLKRLCAEAGWNCIERGPAKVLAELETPHSFCQAAVVRFERGVRLSCELAAFDNAPEPVRAAVSDLLLAVAGTLRLARPVLSAEDPAWIARLEVVFPSPPTPSEFSSALGSVSLGCSLCGNELKTLQDPAVARRYLELRGHGAAVPA